MLNFFKTIFITFVVNISLISNISLVIPKTGMQIPEMETQTIQQDLGLKRESYNVSFNSSENGGGEGKQTLNKFEPISLEGGEKILFPVFGFGGKGSKIYPTHVKLFYESEGLKNKTSGKFDDGYDVFNEFAPEEEYKYLKLNDHQVLFYTAHGKAKFKIFDSKTSRLENSLTPTKDGMGKMFRIENTNVSPNLGEPIYLNDIHKIENLNDDYLMTHAGYYDKNQNMQIRTFLIDKTTNPWKTKEMYNWERLINSTSYFTNSLHFEKKSDETMSIYPGFFLNTPDPAIGPVEIVGQYDLNVTNIPSSGTIQVSNSSDDNEFRKTIELLDKPIKIPRTTNEYYEGYLFDPKTDKIKFFDKEKRNTNNDGFSPLEKIMYRPDNYYKKTWDTKGSTKIHQLENGSLLVTSVTKTINYYNEKSDSWSKPNYIGDSGNWAGTLSMKKNIRKLIGDTYIIGTKQNNDFYTFNQETKKHKSYISKDELKNGIFPSNIFNGNTTHDNSPSYVTTLPKQTIDGKDRILFTGSNQWTIMMPGVEQVQPPNDSDKDNNTTIIIASSLSGITGIIIMVFVVRKVLR